MNNRLQEPASGFLKAKTYRTEAEKTMQVATTTFIMFEHKIEPVRKLSGDSDAAAVLRIVTRNALSGWELVEACGDELHIPVLIFRRLPAGTPAPRYLVEEVPTIAGEDEIHTVSSYLWLMYDRSWLPVCVMDSPFSRPVAVFKLSNTSKNPVELQLLPVSLDLFGKGTVSIVYELLDQQITRNLTLQCIMHGGVYPILVLTTKDVDTNYTYLVDHAKGNAFTNQSTTLADLINERTNNGWEVCGAFEDWFLWPCVAFRRPTDSPPVVPLNISSK